MYWSSPLFPYLHDVPNTKEPYYATLESRVQITEKPIHPALHHPPPILYQLRQVPTSIRLFKAIMKVLLTRSPERYFSSLGNKV